MLSIVLSEHWFSPLSEWCVAFDWSKRSDPEDFLFEQTSFRSDVSEFHGHYRQPCIVPKLRRTTKRRDHRWLEFEQKWDIPLCHSMTMVDHRQYVVEHLVLIHRARTDRRSFEKRLVGPELLVSDRWYAVERECSSGNKPHGFGYVLAKERHRYASERGSFLSVSVTSDLVNKKSFATVEDFNEGIILLVGFIINRFISLFVEMNTREKINHGFLLRNILVIWTLQFHFLDERHRRHFVRNPCYSNVLWCWLR